MKNNKAAIANLIHAFAKALKLHNDKKPLVTFLLLLLAILFSQTSWAATCKYEIDNEWNTGFQAKVSIINESSTAINDWQLSWVWENGSTLDHGWNAVFNCTGSACLVSAPSYAKTVGANQTYSFGFIGVKGSRDTPADKSLVINGTACDTPAEPTPIPVPTPSPTPPPTSSQSRAAAMMPAIIALLLDDEPTETDAKLWTLDSANSSLEYVSVKNSHIAETNRFTTSADHDTSIGGSIDKDGNAVLSINLNSLDTGVDTRNNRMRNFVFETE